MLRKQRNLQVLKIRDKRTLSKTELVICHLVFLNYFFTQISHQEKIELQPFLWKNANFQKRSLHFTTTLKC